MNIIKRIYRFLFERDCTDYSQPFIPGYEDSGFSKYDSYMPSTKTNYVDGISSYHLNYNSYNNYNNWTCGTIPWPGASNIGYHNSRL